MKQFVTLTNHQNINLLHVQLLRCNYSIQKVERKHVDASFDMADFKTYFDNLSEARDAAKTLSAQLNNLKYSSQLLHEKIQYNDNQWFWKRDRNLSSLSSNIINRITEATSQSDMCFSLMIRNHESYTSQFFQLENEKMEISNQLDNAQATILTITQELKQGDQTNKQLLKDLENVRQQLFEAKDRITQLTSRHAEKVEKMYVAASDKKEYQDKEREKKEKEKQEKWERKERLWQRKVRNKKCCIIVNCMLCIV